MKWIIKGEKSAAALMSEDLNISKTTAQVLLNRGVRSKKEVCGFFSPSLEGFGRLSELSEVQKAFEIIKEAIKNKDKITVYGDYDADGVLSSVILKKGLGDLGGDVSCYIPDRFSEGYGLNMSAVKTIYESGADLVICCDNGISALEECGYIKKLGMKLIILDHHSPHMSAGEELLPEADSLIDMKLKDCPYPFKDFCAGGLCYRFISEIYENLGKKIDKEAELFIFAAIATMCDMVSLKGENRILANMGLRLLNSKKNTNRGIIEILTVQGVLGKQITEYTVGFIIGPFINSAGRMAKAADFLDIFLSEDIERARNLTAKLKELNESRKTLTEEAYLKISERLKDNTEDKVIVEYLPEIHESLAGLVAGKIKESFSRPAIILTKGETYAKGSGRSIEAYDMFSAINSCRELFVKYGGHKQAVGLTLKEENIPELKRRLNEDCGLTPEDMEETIYIDRELNFSEVNISLCNELSALAPFGVGFSEPVFGAKGVYIKRIRFVGKSRSFVQLVFFKDNIEVKGVGFGIFQKLKNMVISDSGQEEWEAIYSGRKLLQFFADIVFNVNKNVYNGNESVQLNILDFRKSHYESE